MRLAVLTNGAKKQQLAGQGEFNNSGKGVSDPPSSAYFQDLSEATDLRHILYLSPTVQDQKLILQTAEC